MKSKVIALSSGGVDSACAAVLAKNEGFEVSLLHFLRPRKEFEGVYTKKFAEKYNFPIKIIECDVTSLMRQAQETPLKYVTSTDDIWEYLLGRNFIYLTLAANYAVSVGVSTIVVGFAPHDANSRLLPNAADYPDCHPLVLNDFASLLSDCLHMRLNSVVTAIHFWAPLFKYVINKKEVFELALTLGIDLDDTITCYTPIKEERDDGSIQWRPCGTCLACLHKSRALKELSEEKNGKGRKI